MKHVLSVMNSTANITRVLVLIVHISHIQVRRSPQLIQTREPWTEYLTCRTNQRPVSSNTKIRRPHVQLDR